MTSADHAAWIAARASIWSAVFAGLSVLGVVWGALIARGAASTWRGVHEHAKADECIAAAFDLSHAVNQFIDERIRVNDLWNAPGDPVQFPAQAYDAAWAAWRRFQTAHVVAFRYYADRLDRGTPDRLAETLRRLNTWSGSVPRDLSRTGARFDRSTLVAATTEGADMKKGMRKEAEAIDTALAPPRGKAA
jgi:hypothetical protein